MVVEAPKPLLSLCILPRRTRLLSGNGCQELVFHQQCSWPSHPKHFRSSHPEKTCVAEVDADRKRSTSQKLTPHDAKTRIGQKRGAPSPCSPPKLIDGELFQMSIRKRYLQKNFPDPDSQEKVKEKGKSRMHTCTNRFNMCILSGNATTHRMCVFFP